MSLDPSKKKTIILACLIGGAVLIVGIILAVLATTGKLQKTIKNKATKEVSSELIQEQQVVVEPTAEEPTHEEEPVANSAEPVADQTVETFKQNFLLRRGMRL